ncbi:MAG TPA: SRPBCC family protein [Baekduia sp.]|nr:SRPBCC family protein [Baekduia sp.]
MPTNAVTGPVETRSISIAAPPEAVLAVVGDPYRLPDWAPGFAPAVEPDGDDWLIGTGDAQFAITVRVSAEHGTVDLLRPDNATFGARMRVLHNHTGSELVFTLVFPAGADSEAIRAQMETVEGELETVRTLVEAP